MQTFVVKLASGVAVLIAALSLSIFSLSNEATTEAQQTIDFSQGVSAASKAGLRMTMAVIPVILLLTGLLWFRKKYLLNDAKMDEITASLKRGSV
jgi:melibiose permease